MGVTSVQFTLDGANLGSAFTTAPYSRTWDSTTVADGSHTLALVSTSPINGLERLTIQQKADAYSSEKRAAHYRLFGMEPGERPLQARKAARQILETVLAKAASTDARAYWLNRQLVKWPGADTGADAPVGAV